MLKAVTLNDFRSFREARLPLAPLTVLVGANASGKSNAIEALRLLAFMAQGQKLSALQYEARSGALDLRGRVEDLARRGAETLTLGCELSHTEWNRLELSLGRRADGLHLLRERVTQADEKLPLYDLDQPSTGSGTEVGVAYNNFRRGGNKPHIRCTDQLAIFTQLGSPAAFEARNQDAQRVIPSVTRRFEQHLGSMLFLDPVPARMRDYAFPSESRLRGDGSNLSATLHHLWGDDAQAEVEPLQTQRAELLRFIQSLPEQDIAALSFLTEPRGGVMVQLTETFGGRPLTYDASLLSDGTLRVLSIAAALLSAPAESLVVIEEIDNGVHPSRARHLLAHIRRVAETRALRVLLSTHNPALLDALPDEALGDVVFCYRAPADGHSQLVRLADLPDLPVLMGQGTLGRLVTQGLLERFVKQRPSPEVRQRRALAWLESLSHEATP